MPKLKTPRSEQKQRLQSVSPCGPGSSLHEVSLAGSPGEHWNDGHAVLQGDLPTQADEL